MSDDPTISEADFAAMLDLSNVDDRRAHDATLEPTMAPRFRRDHRKARLAEARAQLAALEGSGNTLRIKAQLAEGGMGRILIAEQSGLRREVAAKTLRDDFVDTDFAERLTREARITGLVEHPNIVPVYALQTDERGAPLMVMRKIEGVPWRAIIRDDAHPMLAAHRDEPLEWHLGVLMSVCDAVSYAHSRGILHLDIKPDNVMVGAFRDVYLVDWGVACSTRDEHRGFLPHVDETTEILGTPAYLAPEVVDPKLARLGPETDVYLLGATLYEVLLKHPPHRGDTVRDLLYAAYLAKPPELPRDVPAELAAIVRRAMQHRPSDRYASADAFRSALARYLRHRGSTKLSTESLARLSELQSALARPHELDDDELRRAQRGFAECRFGFAQALREWPENVEASDGIVDATLLFAELHCGRREYAAALTLLHELPQPGERFASRIEALTREITRGLAEVEALREHRAQSDDVRSRVARAYWVLGLVGGLALPVFVGYGLERAGLYRWQAWHSIAYASLFVLLIASGALAMRRTLMPNRVSRRLVLSLGLLAVLVLLRRLLAFQMGHRGFEDIAMDIFLFGAGCAVVATLTDRRFFAAAIACIVAAVASALFPPYSLLFVGIAGLVGPGLMALLWILGGGRGEPGSDSHRDHSPGASRKSK